MYIFVTQLGELGQSDKEGEAERRRELEEEEMAQAGQPQKLEDDLDQPQQEEEEEPDPQQPDENAVDRKRGRSQQVSYPLAREPAIKEAELWLKRPLLIKGSNIWWLKHLRTHC